MTFSVSSAVPQTQLFIHLRNSLQQLKSAVRVVWSKTAADFENLSREKL